MAHQLQRRRPAAVQVLLVQLPHHRLRPQHQSRVPLIPLLVLRLRNQLLQLPKAALLPLHTLDLLLQLLVQLTQETLHVVLVARLNLALKAFQLLHVHLLQTLDLLQI